MKKLFIIIGLFISLSAKSQIVGFTGNNTEIRSLNVTTDADTVLVREFGTSKLSTMHKKKLYGDGDRGIFRYGVNALSTISGAAVSNIAIGSGAMQLGANIEYNTGIGEGALRNLEGTSFGNIALGGYRTMYLQTAGNRNIGIGYNQEQASLTGDNQLAIGHIIFGTGVNEVNGQSISTGKIGIRVPTPDETFHVDGTLKFVTGNQGAGKVLVSSSTGVADWATSASAFTIPISSVTSATAGSVLFAGTGGILQQKNADFFYDSTNKRLGIGTSSPSTTIHGTAAGSVATFVSTGYSASTLTITDPDGSTQITNAQIKALAQPMVINADASYIGLQTGGVERVRISAAANMLVNGTADPTSAVGAVGIFNGTAPSASIANGTILYSEDVTASSELKVRDEAGNITTLSPHNFSKLDKPSEDLAWSYYSEKDGKYIAVDMAKAIRTIEQLTERISVLEEKLNMKPTPAVKLIKKGSLK